MKFYFTWVDKNVVFDPLIHHQDSTDIFNLSISQKEGLFATAIVTLKNPYPLGQNLPHQWCFITTDNQLIFKGCLVNAPKSVEQGLMQLKFVARSDNFRQQLNQMTIDLKPTIDDLFHDPSRALQPGDILSGRQELIYCNPRDHNLKLSNIFRGAEHIDLGENFFYDSFNMSLINTPIKAIEVTVIALWQQEFTNIIDVSSNIIHASPHGLLTTLNGGNWSERWWQAGQKLGNSNYCVYRASLTKVNPPQTGILKIYPRQSQPVKINGQDKLLTRTWFLPELVLSYNYKQKRQETARFTLEQNLPGNVDTCYKRLTFHLQKLIETNQIWQSGVTYYPGARVINGEYVWQCRQMHQADESFAAQYWHQVRRGMHISDQAATGTFFTNDRGAKALEYAHQIAQAHLANSARAVQICLRGTVEDLINISTDHSLTISDSRIPGGRVTGKVYSYNLCVDGLSGTRYVEVELLLSVGSPAAATATTAANFDYWDLDYSELDLSTLHDSFNSWQYDTAPQGLDNPDYYSNGDFIEYVEIGNDADWQNHLLHDKEFATPAALNEFLGQHSTQVSFRLKNLSTKACHTQELRLQTKTIFSAPTQISFP